MATTTKVFNMAGGKHSAEAYSSFEGLLYGSCVADGFVITKSSSNMNCSIAAGAGLIKVGTTYARRVAIEGDPLTVTVSAASSTLARRDTIVLYVDNSVTPTTSVEDNTNNILKGTVVAGTPAQNPTAPNATTIQSAVGAGNPYIILYDILVPANATNLSTATLYDRRVMAPDALMAKLSGGGIKTSQIVDSAITDSKIDWSTVAYSTSEKVVGKWIDGKVLYQRVIKISNAAKDTTTDYAHGISNYAFGFISNLFVHRPDNNATREINTTDSTSSGSVAQLNATNLSYRIPATTWSWTTVTLDLYAIVCYTKTS